MDDVGQEGNNLGLSMTAGVITSIPYDSVPADAKSPIRVDYLPKNDNQPKRKDPLPHHLNQGGSDFHQYPAWDPGSAPLPSPSSSTHPTGPRPPPHAGSHTSLKPLTRSDLPTRGKQSKTCTQPYTE